MSTSFVNCDSFFFFCVNISLQSNVTILGQIYTSDVKNSSIYVETEQTLQVSTLAVDLPEKLLSCCFHCLFINFSVVMIFR